MTSSRINIRHSAGGVTIRATGAAAQALADAITHSAESVKAATSPVIANVLIMQVHVVDQDNTYRAIPLTTAQVTAAGLKGVRATCTAGPHQAINALLAKATPPRRVARVVERIPGIGRSDTYTIEAEVA